MSNTEEYFLHEGDTFLLPSNAIYRINDKLDDASDLSSVYSNQPESAIGDGQDADELYMDDAEFARRLYKFGLDVNGLPLRDDLIFKTFDKAANFTLEVQELSWWQKFGGVKAKPVEVPHIALWDYFGGTSCLDTNCTAGDQINVLCEEYQVREISDVTSDGRKFLRLPMQWSLGRWITNRSFQPNVGLIPSCWLIKKAFYEANKRLFFRPTWFMGIADVTTAYDYLLEDRSSYRPATKGALYELGSRVTGILFPTLAEGQDPAQVRLRSQKTSSAGGTAASSTNVTANRTINVSKISSVHETRTAAGADDEIRSGKTNFLRNSSKDTMSGMGLPDATTDASRKQLQSPFKKSSDQRMEGSSKAGSEKDDFDPEHTEHTALPFYVKPYTIRRSRIGRYLLFNRQFSTLYDLVYYFTNYQSPIPHKLNYGPTKKQQVVYFHSVPAPFSSPARDIHAMTMKSEQWAARHFDQVTEPALLSQAFSFISRSIFDPYKKSHMEFARSINLSDDNIEAARSYIGRFLPNKHPATSQDHEKQEATAKEDPTLSSPPTDESVLKTDAAIEIDIKNLKFSAEDMLGSGAFGAVYRGKLKTVDGQEVDVAIKKLKMVAPETDLRQPWISEMEILQIISHPNVTRFYGFCYDETKEYAMLTFELMDIGSLADFMKAHEYNISSNEHVDFLIQIARGMGHLHSLDPPIVHGDLAARNVLMCHHPKDETRYLLKISDFGLSKTTRHEIHFFPDDPQKMPFKWLPPEVLHRRELSTKSDVWSYAILATEIYGVIDPYGMLPNEKVLPFLNDGHRMEKPSTMPHYIYNILLRCWRKQPVDRPTFNEIVRDLMPYYIEFESSHIVLLTSRIVAESMENKKIKE